MRSIILVLSLLLGVLSLAGVVWVFWGDDHPLAFSITTDGLFMTLILLTLAACFLLNAFLEMRDQGLIGKKKSVPAKAPRQRPVK